MSGFAANKRHAIVDYKGDYSYRTMFKASQSFAEHYISPKLNVGNLNNTDESVKVAYLVEKDATYVLA